jgi:nucleotide-binding universal stress UspA family protein
MMYHRIIVPLDGSKLAESVLAHACALAHCMGSEVILMRVMVYSAYDYLLTDPTVSASLREEMEREASNYLEPLADALRDEGIRASAVAVIVNSPIADAIIEFARDKQADLIAMSTHGRTGPSRWFLGSIADRVVRGAGMPVLMVRPVKKH